MRPFPFIFAARGIHASNRSICCNGMIGVLVSSWILQFFKRYRPVVSWPSIIRWLLYSVWQGRGSTQYESVIRLRLRFPYACRVMIRPISNDLYTFDEVFLAEVYRDAVRQLGPISYMVDAGANIGFASLYVDALCGPLKKCICIEPDPDNIRILKYNLRHLQKRNALQVQEGALWGHDGIVSLSPLISGHVNQRSCSSQSSVSGVNEVAAFSVSSLLANGFLPRIDLLKIDIEGGETEVFAGDLSWLRNVRMLAVEFHGNSRAETGFDEIMRRFGFDVLSSFSMHTILACRA
jgi:FkbM family methyltransferase